MGMLERDCNICGKVFTIWNYERDIRKYCSRECHKVAQRFSRISITCSTCGKIFLERKGRKHAKYCSKMCFGESLKPKEIQKTCNNCGLEFLVYLSKLDRKFCSQKCAQTKLEEGIQITCLSCNHIVRVMRCRKGIKFCCMACKLNYYKINGSPRRKKIKVNCIRCNKEYLIVKSRLLKTKFCSRLCYDKFVVEDERYNNIRKDRANRLFKDFIFPKEDTSIEVKIQEFLKSLKIEFRTHVYMKEIENQYRCDIFVPKYNLIIECDGDYWHGNPEKFSKERLTEKQINQKERDNLRTSQLINAGYVVLRLWECDIKKMDINLFNKYILNITNEKKI